ncbi:hypothetical protein O7623_10540 [Solwaraspora sp. WMMD791]|uniref:hypothetical protein n=1 Tax=Solwaraspora sp. WMMD791 TaxID=3016086 RepID=UPI00249C66FD|nr:hypothetical protein [Solwaraspora sp. WMMD791]WFE29587.1 hypothetical protein O7623_10540 [Solwaraspora sp. WMMD791]
MDDDQVQHWQDHRAAGNTVVLRADRRKLDETWRRNDWYVGSAAVALVTVGSTNLALTLTGLGRATTFLLLSVLLLILVGVLGLGLFMRRRVRRYRTAGDRFISVDSAGITLAGVPTVPWDGMLGVLVSQDPPPQHTSRYRRWVHEMTFRAGGSRTVMVVGIREPRRYRDAATGSLRSCVNSSGGRFGMLMVEPDVALDQQTMVRLREALQAGATVAGVPFETTQDARRVGSATYAMLQGNRLEPAP